VKQSEAEKKNDFGALFIPGGCLIGLGIGLLVGNPGAGVLIGLGSGFMLWALVGIFHNPGNS
jgi:hypothetical protein